MMRGFRSSRLAICIVAAMTCAGPSASVQSPGASTAIAPGGPPLAGTPLSDVKGVHLGMTAADVTRLRPDARLSAYTGYREIVDGTVLVYAFPAGVVKTRRPDRSARVDMLMALREMSSADSARKQWRESIASVSAIQGAPASCEQLGGQNPGVRAVWRLSEGRLEIAARDPEPALAGMLSHRLVFTFTAREEMPLPPGASAVPCSRLL